MFIELFTTGRWNALMQQMMTGKHLQADLSSSRFLRCERELWLCVFFLISHALFQLEECQLTVAFLVFLPLKAAAPQGISVRAITHFRREHRHTAHGQLQSEIPSSLKWKKNPADCEELDIKEEPCQDISPGCFQPLPDPQLQPV